MKVFFEDGPLADDTPLSLPVPGNVVVIDSGRGFSACETMLDKWMRWVGTEDCVYTNATVAMEWGYVWNDVLGVPELYIRHEHTGEWTRIDQLTNRALRRGHDLFKMWRSGEFSHDANWTKVV